MALTRKFLKALGIEEEKIDEIISAHGDTVTALKDEIAQAKQSAEGLDAITKERDNYKTQYEALQKTSGDVAKVQADFDAYKAEVANKETNAKKTELIKAALTAQKANPAAIKLLLKEIDLSGVELENDALKDADSIIKPIKENYGEFFGTSAEQGTPPTNPPTGGKDEQSPTSLVGALRQKYK